MDSSDINNTLGIGNNTKEDLQSLKADTLKTKELENGKHTNKVVNVTLAGGLIGLLGDSPQNSLNRKIKAENKNGWRVVQVIPSASGNLFLYLFRLILLIITIFLYTTANGYYVILEKKLE